MAKKHHVKLGPKAIQPTPAGKWTLRKMINGRPLFRVLDVTSAAEELDAWAKTGTTPEAVLDEADRIIGLALAGKAKEVAESKTRKERVATIGEIIERYETHDRTQNLKESTRRQNVTEFTRVIALALNIKTTMNEGQTRVDPKNRRRAEFKAIKVAGSAEAAQRRKDAVANLSANVLTKELVADYVRLRKAEGPKIYGFEDRPAHLKAKNGKLNTLDMERVKRSIASELRRARALFAEKSRLTKNLVCPVSGIYTDLRLPDTLREFTHAFTFIAPVAHSYKLPNRRTMDKLWSGLEKLKAEKPEVWKGFMIAADTGLRLDELRFLMWAQISELPKMVQIMVESNGTNKGTKSGRSRPVKLSAELYRQLCEMETSPTYVIGGGHEFRAHHLGREVANYMRAHGWTRRQCSHEMRKWFGAQIADKTGDLVQVMHVLGHADYGTTKGTYEAMVSYPEYEDITASLLGKPETVKATRAA